MKYEYMYLSVQENETLHPISDRIFEIEIKIHYDKVESDTNILI